MSGIFLFDPCDQPCGPACGCPACQFDRSLAEKEREFTEREVDALVAAFDAVVMAEHGPTIDFYTFTSDGYPEPEAF